MSKSNMGVAVLVGVVLLVLSIPVLVAPALAGDRFGFAGFLYNPLDGNSYLAKMVEGARGDWKFTLPYTAQPGEGAYIFLFYLLLGKLAALLDLPMIATFHTARLLCSLYLLIELWRFCRAFFTENEPLAFRSYMAAVLFSGMGWLGLALNRLTPDLIVPEAYTFLSCYANPHFPLSLGLILLVLRQVCLLRKVKWHIWLLLVGFILANLSPFSVVISLLVITGSTLWNWIGLKKLEVRNAFLFGIGALPVMVYQLIAIKSDPILSAWDAQNLTPAPALPDLVIALLPGLLFAFSAIITLIKRRHVAPPERVLALWMGLGIVLTYLPFNLQRRFLVGLSIPVALLAVIFIDTLQKPRLKRLLSVALYVCMLPTILLVIAMGLISVAQSEPRLVLSNPEAQALAWIQANTPKDALILASEDIGVLIPARTGRRVIYGHPFETVDAEKNKAEVGAFFSGSLDVPSAAEYLLENQVDYIFYGLREKALGEIDLGEFSVLFSNGEVDIYQAAANP